MKVKDFHHINHILRVPPELIADLEKRMGRATGRSGVISSIERDIHEITMERLSGFGLDFSASSEDVYEALLAKVKDANTALERIFRRPRFDTTEGCGIVLRAAKELAAIPKGFFLKREKAEEMLHKNPPANVMKELGYQTAAEMFSKEDVWQIFASLRFAERKEWLNNIFFRQYERLSPADFEEREIVSMVLDTKLAEIGKKFIGKKLHNISHLKELGLIFILPYGDHGDGETIQTFTLVLHYFHELNFYARLFRGYARDEHFNDSFISALRGDVGGMLMKDHSQSMWRIVQRYLAKDDTNDPRLFEAHVNPEALHWRKGEGDFQRFGERFSEEGLDVRFWNNLDYVGDYFYSRELQKDLLVSFDLVDNIISLSHQSGMASMYLYHQQEALWNEIFVRYFDDKKMEHLMMEHFHRGYIKIPEDIQKRGAKPKIDM